MDTQSLKSHLLALPEIADWPELAGFLDNSEDPSRPDWGLPVITCQAVGGEASQAIPGSAAIACMQESIILVDDILDDDPRGHYLRVGVGRAANLALAFQALSFRLIERAVDDLECRAAVTASLTWLALATAFGQQLDAQNLKDEESYWRLVKAKSTPFYASACHIGALLGRADSKQAKGLRDLGALLGEIIQIQDDLVDAFQTPANPDWKQGRNNLPLLYALTADHPTRSRFLELRPRAGDPEALREAQQILLSSGAVSYCVYHIVRRHQLTRNLLDSLYLPNPEPLLEMLASQTKPLIQWLETSGARIPPELQQ
jgi:geranylgeranyl diphosphate synthase type I